MVQKGLAHLEKCSDHGEVGGNALIGLTLVRNGYDENHPRVARAISKCVGAPAASQNNYSLGKKTGAGKPEGPAPGKIKFQDHTNPVRFRNIWIVPGRHAYSGSYYAVAR